MFQLNQTHIFLTVFRAIQSRNMKLKSFRAIYNVMEIYFFKSNAGKLHVSAINQNNLAELINKQNFPRKRRKLPAIILSQVCNLKRS